MSNSYLLIFLCATAAAAHELDPAGADVQALVQSSISASDRLADESTNVPQKAVQMIIDDAYDAARQELTGNNTILRAGEAEEKTTALAKKKPKTDDYDYAGAPAGGNDGDYAGAPAGGNDGDYAGAPAGGDDYDYAGAPAGGGQQEYEWNADPSPIGQVGGQWNGAGNCQCTKPGAAANERTQSAYYYLIGATWNNGGKIADCDSNHLNNCCYNELGETFTYEALDKACAAKCDTWDDCFGYYVGTKEQPAMRGVPGFQPNVDAPGTCYAAHAICTVYYTEGTWENRPASWSLAQRNGVAPGWMTYNHNGATPQYNGVGFWCGNRYGCERKEA